MRLAIAPYKAVKYACLHYHYSKSVPMALCSYSVFNDKDEWCGVIMYSLGANPRLGKPFGLAQGQICELVRVALNGKQESTSKAVAISLKLVKKHNPLLKLIISYADCDQEHTGIIYQATNWIYAGKVELDGGTPKFKVFGKVRHPRSLGSLGWTVSLEWIRKHKDPKAEYVYTKGKHKYLFPLNKQMTEQVGKLKQPYPKKEVADTNVGDTNAEVAQLVER